MGLRTQATEALGVIDHEIHLPMSPEYHKSHCIQGGGEMVELVDPAALVKPERVRLHPYDVMVGPVTHLAEERERLAQLRYEGFRVKPLGATIGGLVHGVDITKPLDDATIAELRRCLLDFKVIFFRDQPLTPGGHVAFAGRFGDLETHPFIPGNTDEPQLVRFEKEAKVGGFENVWHSDVPWRAIPSAEIGRAHV